ncbi:unnamed protein product [Effrenium voratum]|nr:unnamed protein product [Effrenium voratum]
MVIPHFRGAILFQRRASWKWRMGGLWDVGLSETVELGEDLGKAAHRAVAEELGPEAALEPAECCRLSTGWSGSMPQMQVCQSDHNFVFTASGPESLSLGERDTEVDTLEYWTLEELKADADRIAKSTRAVSGRAKRAKRAQVKELMGRK